MHMKYCQETQLYGYFTILKCHDASKTILNSNCCISNKLWNAD